jgi:hypothetical protein
MTLPVSDAALRNFVHPIVLIRPVWTQSDVWLGEKYKKYPSSPNVACASDCPDPVRESLRPYEAGGVLVSWW